MGARWGACSEDAARLELLHCARLGANVTRRPKLTMCSTFFLALLYASQIMKSS